MSGDINSEAVSGAVSSLMAAWSSDTPKQAAAPSGGAAGDADLVADLAGCGGYTSVLSVNDGNDTYVVNREGVWHSWSTKKEGDKSQVIAYRPFLVRRRLRDDEDRTYYEIAWLTGTGEVRTVRVPAADVISRERLVKIFPELVVNAANANKCLNYIGHAINENSHLLGGEGIPIATALGWPRKGTDVFVCGPDNPRPMDDVKNTGAWLEGHAMRGDLDQWRREVYSCHDRPVIQVAISAAFSAPLLRILGKQPFAVDISGSTSTGKSTALKAAASVAGDPEALMKNWEMTRVAVEQHLSVCRGMPFFIDETQLAKDDPKKIEDVIYGLSQGKSKSRSRQDGSALMDSVAFETVMITTGEVALAGMTRTGGVPARVVSLTGQPCRDKAQADGLLESFQQHHGLALPVFIGHVQDQDPADIKQRYTTWRRKLGALASTRVAGRIANDVAVLALANELAFGQGLQPLQDERVWEWLVNGGDAVLENEDDRPRQALDAVLGWAAAHCSRFYGYSGAPAGVEWLSSDEEAVVGGISPVQGWLGAWREDYVSFVPDVLKERLEKLGYDAQRIILDWRERGWLEHDAGKSTRRVRMGTATPRQVKLIFLEPLYGERVPPGERLLNVTE